MTSSTNDRLISLDALRGFTIAAMVIVNTPGSWSHVYAPLLHAEWHGITPTDLIFPFFLFIVGVSISLAYTKLLSKGANRKSLYQKIVIRSAKILLVGWFLWLWPEFNFEGMRFVGVLPRIAIVFLICAVLFLTTSWKQQAVLGAAILIIYWILLAFVPVPIDPVIQQALQDQTVQYSAGQLSIGEITQISEGMIAATYEPGVNITAWLDRILIPGRFWQVTWDPEGFMSTFPAIVTGILGMLAGQIIIKLKDIYSKITWLFFFGFVLYLAGVIWSWNMPINKNLWTSSFTLWTAGMATMGLAACILVIDHLGQTKWTMLGRVYGANAITSYCLAGMMTVIFYNDIFFGHSLNGLWMQGFEVIGLPAKLASFTYAIIYMLIIFIPALILYRKKIYIKV